MALLYHAQQTHRDYLLLEAAVTFGELTVLMSQSPGRGDIHPAVVQWLDKSGISTRTSGQPTENNKIAP